MLTASIFEICNDSHCFELICNLYRFYIIDDILFESMLKERFSTCLQ